MSEIINESQNDSSFLIVDFDNLSFDYKSVFVNFLGTIANAINNTLISPWNFVINSDSVNNGSDLSDNLEQTSINNCINNLLNAEIISFNLIEEALSALNSVLSSESSKSNPKLNSLCNVFNGSTLYYLSAKDGQISINELKTNDKLSLVNLNQLLFQFLPLGLHNFSPGSLLNVCTNLSDLTHFTDYYIGSIGLKDFNNYRIVLITSFPESTMDYLTIHGVTRDNLNSVSLINKVEDIKINSQSLLNVSIKTISNNNNFIDNTTRHFLGILGENVVVNKTHVKRCSTERPLKVDLDSVLDVNILSGTLGCFLLLKNRVKIVGEVFKGSGRGFPLLGIPTANLKCNSLPHLITGNIILGVYIGYGYINGSKEVSEDTRINAIVSIGFNPHFYGENYSVEPYFYHKFNESLLGLTVRLDIYGYLRTDSKYSSLEDLVQAIQSDLHFNKLILTSMNNV
uniref:riboflavin kinase n=1 Tax=Theileria annulata TaxID=5874 RepID=A0A3B0MGJ9_THEAN